MTMPANLKVDDALADRLNRLAAARNQSPDVILREALTEYLDRQNDRRNPEIADRAEGKNYPRRHPVGGIITPV
jgi:predicted transcriptional regulator